MIAEKIRQTALAYVGKTETAGNSGFADPAFQKEMQRVGWQKGMAWCSFFAELAYAEAYKGDPAKSAAVTKLFSGSAVQTFTNFKNAGYRTDAVPNVGDLAVWRYGNGWQGHIGIVVSVDGKGGFQSVEGNTNDAGGREGIMVAVKRRRTGEPFRAKGLNIVGFISPMS